jgi:Tol biopolymer transport system component
MRLDRSFRTLLALFCLGLFLGPVGCKKKEVPPPPPIPTPTPVIPMGSLVFVQQGHLARLDIEAKQVVPLTSGKSMEWFPAVSPDGTKVAYWSNAKTEIYNLWKINTDGTGRVALTENDSHALRTEDQNLLINTAPVWSPDGARIFYSQAGDIWVIDLDGFNPESILMGKEALCPALSPDGKTLLYISRLDDPVFNLWSMNLSDRSLKKVTEYTDWNVGSPSYSPDGRKVLFNLYRSNTTQVYTIDATGGNPLNLTTNSRSLCPRFAVKDRRLVYCSFETTSEGDLLNLYMANANGTEPKALTTAGGTSPSWAPAVPLPAAGLPTPIGK